MTAITHEDVRRNLKYVKSTGRMYQRDIDWSWVEIGTGSLDNGYKTVRYRNKRYRLHRLAYFWVTGEWPVEIDHKDHVRSNNRWKNLRARDHTFNMENRIKAHKNNGTGVLGVNFRYGKYGARIRVGGKDRRLGTFDTPEEAYGAYLKAKRTLHAGNTL